MTAKQGTTPGSHAGTAGMSKRLKSYREELLKLLFLGLPMLLIQMAYKSVADRLVAKPWHVFSFVCLLLFAMVIAWWAVKGRKELLLRGRFLVFFVAYILAFSLASSSDLLVWNRNLTVFERKLRRTWLVPASWGDWRYLIVPKRALVPRDIVIVTMREASDPNERRMEIAQLIGVAANNGALGIAFDYYFDRDSDVDSLVGLAVERAKNTKVIIGFTLQRVNGEIRPLPTAPQIAKCLPADRQGHLVGLVEPDHVVRLIPLYFRWQKSRPSLSLKVAQDFADRKGKKLKIPSNELLYFIEPKDSFPQLSYEEMAKDRTKCALMRDSWVLVGEESSAESFETPFGRTPGVLIHAYAVHSLRHGHFMRRTPWWSGLVMIFLSCYFIFLQAARGASRLTIVGTASFFSVLIVFVSVFLLRFLLIWLDLIYALVAIWLLVIVLTVLRKCTTPSTTTTSKTRLRSLAIAVSHVMKRRKNRVEKQDVCGHHVMALS